MYNTGTYGMGMSRRVIYQQPVVIGNPYATPINPNYQQFNQQINPSSWANNPRQ